MGRLFAAHISEDGRIQTIKEHLEGTAKRAKRFGGGFCNGEIAFICGLIHDIGKYSEKFQKRIYENGNKVDHSTAGAVEIDRSINKIGRLLAYCIAGHHTGLPDGGSPADTPEESTLYGRLKRRNLEPYTCYEDEITLPESARLNISPLERMGFSTAFYIRMLYSCLVDADFLDTEAFMQNKERSCDYGSIKTLNAKLDTTLKKYEHPDNDINTKRTEILKKCVEKSSLERGLYSLTVPTGGGKTIASMTFALKHALTNGMERVIYVIPYNSIIEQNAKVFEDILGKENVLEHHSGFSYDQKSDDDESRLDKLKRLATENWDMPVIVTTTVQFFESLFANKSSRCRKLHNIANSVIVFDEAQLLPIKYLKPCVHAISELVHNYRSTALLCSATQPTLGGLFPKKIEIHEICENTDELFRFFKRTRLEYIGELNDKELTKRLNHEKQVLCIVTTRKQAQNIYRLLEEDGSFHLSTFMYPRHRKEALEDIKLRLKEGEICRVVSTSLIEAGVDVDFPVVYRAEAGLDSLIQAAGRCNREGMNPISPVFIFKPEQEYRQSIPAMLKKPLGAAASVISGFDDVSSPEAIQAYFNELYRFEGEDIDNKKIVKRFEDGFEQRMSFPFAQVGEEFRLIDNATHAVIIPDDDKANEFVQRLKNGERSRELLRNIQQYTVNIYDNNYNALHGMKSIEIIDSEIAVLADMNKYCDKTGLDCSADSGQAIFV